MPTLAHPSSRSRGFVGRTRDLEALDDLVGREPLVTVLGPPGIGKTRLARQFLDVQALRSSSSPTAFCDLTTAIGLDDITRLVAGALDIPLGQGESPVLVEQLGRALAARGPLYLLLDNFEQVATYAAATVGVWLDRAPALRMLVTSRVRLHLGAEVLFDLEPLSEPESVQLFVARAQAVSRQYALTESERPRVEAIVRWCEGIPLAIELVSARMRTWTSAEILGSLRLDAFTQSRVDAPARHASLRRAMEWSWSTLTPWEQAAFRQSTVFQGGFDREAAEAVLDLGAHPDAPSVIEVLDALCDKSLVRRYEHPEEPGRSRFRLYVYLQEFGRERLVESGEFVATEARHTRHYLDQGRAWADALEGPEALAALRRQASEMDNLRAVHRRALERTPATVESAVEALGAAEALAYRLFLLGPLPLLGALLDAALGAPGVAEAPPDLVAKVFYRRGRVNQLAGQIDLARSDLDRALQITQQGGDCRLLGIVWAGLGQACMARQNEAETEDWCERAISTGDRMACGMAFSTLAALRWRQTRTELAVLFYEKALGCHRENGDIIKEALTLSNLAVMKGEAGRLDEACALGEQVLAAPVFRVLRRAYAVSLANQALLEHTRGRLEVAAPLYERALTVLREIGHSSRCGGVQAQASLLYEAQGRTAEARSLCEAVPALLGGERSIEAALARAARASFVAAEGHIEQAEAQFDEAERETWHNAHAVAVFGGMRGHLDLARARAARDAGDLDAARAHERAALRRARGLFPEATPPDASRVPDSAEEHGPPRWLGLDARLAQLSVERAIERHLARYPAAAVSARRQPPLEILVEHRSFRVPGGELVSLAGKPVLARVLVGLARQWQRARGEPLTVAELRALGWPREKMSASAATGRVYTAVWSLRKLGLEGVLVQREGGYLLDPEASIRIVDTSS